MKEVYREQLSGKSPQEISKAFESEGLAGLEALGLSDGDIILSLRRYCVGGSKVMQTLHSGGWNLDRFQNALGSVGQSEAAIEKFSKEYRALDK